MPARVFDRERYAVLIADDDPGSVSAVREGIAHEGYRTLTASSGHEAIEVVRHEIVHAVIMDVNMPNLDGIQTFEMIEQVVSVHLPCIFMSGDITHEVRVRAMRVRAYTVLAKPLNLRLIRNVVDDVIHEFYGVE